MGMSSNEPPIDEPPVEKTAEEIATELARLKAQRLNSIARKIRKARSAITFKLLAIADLLAGAKDELRVYGKEGVEDVKRSQATLRSFVNNEGMLPRDEFKTFQRLSSITAEERELLTEQGSGFSVLKAIVDDAGLRNDVIKRMRANIVMDAAAVRRVRLQRKLAAETPLQAFLRVNPNFAVIESRKETRAATKSFEKDAAAFVLKLGDLAQAGDLSEDDHQARWNILRPIAGDLVARFRAFFDAQDMPVDWRELHMVYSSDEEYGKISGMLLALETMASGDFYIPDEENGGYCETDDLNIDHRLIDAVGQIVGISINQALAMPTAKRVKRILPAEAKANTRKLVAPERLLRSVEICAGAGGQALGLHDAGFRAHAIFEREADAAETLRQHFHGAVERVFTEDVTRVDFRHYRGRVDLVAGGVPCQPFSTAGVRKGEEDDRDLFRRAVEIVDEIQPRAFFFENVKGFGDAPYLAYRSELSAAFEAIGYQCKLFPILGSDYGLAQGRPRVAFVGFRDPDAMSRFKVPPAFPQWGSSLSSAIGDLVSSNGWKGFDEWTKIANGRCPTIVGGSRKSDKFSFACGHTKETWALLGIDSTELSAAAPGPDHKGQFRLTLGMGARIQGFPDGWRFQGKKKQIKSQIGNAFPPVMAKAVGLAIHAALENVEFDYEKALTAGFTTPPPPQSAKNPGSGRLTGLSRYNMGHDVPELEHRFFGELSMDENTGADLIIRPGDYQVLKTQEKAEKSETPETVE